MGGMAIALAYLFYFVASISSNIQRRHIAKRRATDTGQIDFAFRVMALTFVLSAVLIFFNSPRLDQSWLVLVLLALACGVFGTVSLSCQYIAQRHVEAGVTNLLSNLYVPVAILLASIILHEGLKPLELVGAAILLGSVILASRKHRLSRWRFDKYFWLMAFNGIALAFVLTAERSLIKENGLTAGTWISWGAQSICLGLVALAVGSKSQYDLKETAVTGGLRFLQQLSWVVLVTIVANLSLTSAVSSFRIVLVFIAGAIFLHEREDLRRKIIGSLLATLGLLLTILA